MPEQPIDFQTAQTGTPEKAIFDCVLAALQVVSIEQFAQATLTNLFAAVPTMPDGQKLRVRIAVNKLSSMFTIPEAKVNLLLTYVLYGTWQEVGLDDLATENTLQDAEREGILQVVFLTAAQIVGAKAQQLGALASWSFEVPDWKIVIPDPEP
jgi:hypothetical protein